MLETEPAGAHREPHHDVTCTRVHTHTFTHVRSLQRTSEDLFSQTGTGHFIFPLTPPHTYIREKRKPSGRVPEAPEERQELLQEADTHPGDWAWEGAMVFCSSVPSSHPALSPGSLQAYWLFKTLDQANLLTDGLKIRDAHWNVLSNCLHLMHVTRYVHWLKWTNMMASQVVGA